MPRRAGMPERRYRTIRVYKRCKVLDNKFRWGRACPFSPVSGSIYPDLSTFFPAAHFAKIRLALNIARRRKSYGAHTALALDLLSSERELTRTTIPIRRAI